MLSLRMKELFTMLVAIALTGCASPDARQTTDGQATLFRGMGNHQRAVTTSSPGAQQYFNQGLIWAYAFNHDEAIRSFTAATRLDPQCAMAWWGIALCNGPHINNPAMTADRSRQAWDALQKALASKDLANPTEQALILALSKRYADPPPSDRKPLDLAYANAMRDVWQTHRHDADVSTLFAESLMDLRPWDLWMKDGTAHPETLEILAALDGALRIDAEHPGANHLYIHALEASPQPQRANAAADRLRGLVPASGHLVHMPSHIDVLTGRWALASEQNEQAIRIDREYRAVSPRQDFYRVYMAHNHHMLAFASMMEGRREAALRAAHELIDSVPEEYLKRETALVDPVMGIVYDVQKRFGLWDDILQQPAPPSILPITTAMWRFSRGVAFAAKGQLTEADREREAFNQVKAFVPADAVMAINKARHVLDIAGHMLDGEIAYRLGFIDQSITALHKAVELEGQLMYMEPPEWIHPVRHVLGAVLLSAGRYAEAEEVYRQDLKKWPGNGWSLYGLSRSLHGQGRSEEAKKINDEFHKAWSRADIRIESSCLCVPKT